jgi:hypothetical protein
MKNPVCDMIIFNEVKDLGFIYVTGVGQRVKYPVSVNGKTLSVPLGYLFLVIFSYCITTQAGPWRKSGFLTFVKIISYFI